MINNNQRNFFTFENQISECSLGIGSGPQCFWRLENTGYILFHCVHDNKASTKFRVRFRGGFFLFLLRNLRVLL